MRLSWKAIVFDLDGTLANSLRDLAEATNAALANNGFSTYSVDKYRYMLGNGLRKLIERAAGENTALPVIDRIMADFLYIYDKQCLKYTRPYEGIPETLAHLKEQDVPLFVVTNKPDTQAHKIVSHLFGDELFCGVFGNNEGRKIKPDPALTLQALASINAAPSNSLFVGDSDVDMLTAANAGMKSAGVAWGFREIDELRNAGAQYILHKSSEILNTY